MKFANHTRDFKKEKTKKRERKILITRSLLYNYSYSLYFNVILIKKFEFRFFFLVKIEEKFPMNILQLENFQCDNFDV